MVRGEAAQPSSEGATLAIEPPVAAAQLEISTTSSAHGTLTIEAAVLASDPSPPTADALMVPVPDSNLAESSLADVLPITRDASGSPAHSNVPPPPPPPPPEPPQLALIQTKPAVTAPPSMHFADDLFEGLGDLPDSAFLSPHDSGPPSRFAAEVPTSNGGVEDTGPSQSPATRPNGAHAAASPGNEPSAGNEPSPASPSSTRATSPLENGHRNGHAEAGPLAQPGHPPDGDGLGAGPAGEAAPLAGRETDMVLEGEGAGPLALDVPEGWSGPVTEEVQRILGWHMANLEYGCSAPLHRISLAHWNQV